MLYLSQRRTLGDLTNIGALFKGPKVGTELNSWSNYCIKIQRKWRGKSSILDLSLEANELSFTDGFLSTKGCVPQVETKR